MTEPALGIDSSKLKFNVCLINTQGKLKHKVFPNNPAGCEQLNEWLTKQGIDLFAFALSETVAVI